MAAKGQTRAGRPPGKGPMLPEQREKDPKNKYSKHVPPSGAGPFDGVPTAHVQADPTLLAIWDEIVANLPAKILSKSDTHCVEAAVLATHACRLAPIAANINAMRIALSELGMTPGGRARMDAPSQQESNPFEAFLAGSGAKN